MLWHIESCVIAFSAAQLGLHWSQFHALLGGNYAEAGGFVIYPNKPNNNAIQSVYRK